MKSKVRSFHIFLLFVPLIFLAFLLIACNAPEKPHHIQGKDILEGSYNIPYEIPSKDSIKKSLQLIRDYFYRNTKFRIIDSKTGNDITDFSKPDKNAGLDNGDHGLFPLWSYTQGVTYSGMLNAWDATGDKKFLDYPEKCLDFFMNNLTYFEKVDSAYGEVKNSYRAVLHTGSLDDCGAMGAALIRLYNINKDSRLRKIIDHIADYITSRQFRLKDGTLARHSPQPRSIWADDMYMSVPFLAEMGNLTGEKKYYDDAVKQVLQMSNYLFRRDKKLFDHGVNLQNEYDPDIFWGRANGWCLVAINDLLDRLPENYKGRDSLLKILNTHVQGLVSLQGGDGFWHNLLDKTDSFTETSCTAMFVYGIAHAINKGWIDYTFGSAAQAGWNAVASRINSEGQVDGTCQGTTLASDNVYYYHRPATVWAPHGYGTVLMAGSEMIRLLDNKNIVIKKATGTFHYELKEKINEVYL